MFVPSGIDKGKVTDTHSSSERRDVVETASVLGAMVGGGGGEPSESESITIGSSFGVLTT
jgi:hypothetical protein